LFGFLAAAASSPLLSTFEEADLSSDVSKSFFGDDVRLRLYFGTQLAVDPFLFWKASFPFSGTIVALTEPFLFFQKENMSSPPLPSKLIPSFADRHPATLAINSQTLSPSSIMWAASLPF